MATVEKKAGREKTEKRDGVKWVDRNYEAKKAAREANGMAIDQSSIEDADIFSGGELPYSVALITSDHTDSSNWSVDNLPEILFYLHPPPSKHQGQNVNFLVDDETGKVALSDDGGKIKNFPVLPRRISLEVEGTNLLICTLATKLTIK